MTVQYQTNILSLKQHTLSLKQNIQIKVFSMFHGSGCQLIDWLIDWLIMFLFQSSK